VYPGHWAAPRTTSCTQVSASVRCWHSAALDQRKVTRKSLPALLNVSGLGDLGDEIADSAADDGGERLLCPASRASQGHGPGRRHPRRCAPPVRRVQRRRHVHGWGSGRSRHHHHQACGAGTATKLELAMARLDAMRTEPLSHTTESCEPTPWQSRKTSRPPWSAVTARPRSARASPGTAATRNSSSISGGGLSTPGGNTSGRRSPRRGNRPSPGRPLPRCRGQPAHRIPLCPLLRTQRIPDGWVETHRH
jgi:hypothetical protein